MDFFHRRNHSARKSHDLLPLADDATGDLAAEAAEVVQAVVGRIVRAVDPLHRQAETVQVPIARDVHGLEVAEQRRAGDTTASAVRR